MDVITDALTHDEARTIEGTLIRRRLREAIDEGLIDATEPIEEQLKKAGLDNKNRGRVPERFIDLKVKDYLKGVIQRFEI